MPFSPSAHKTTGQRWRTNWRTGFATACLIRASWMRRHCLNRIVSKELTLKIEAQRTPCRVSHTTTLIARTISPLSRPSPTVSTSKTPLPPLPSSPKEHPNQSPHAAPKATSASHLSQSTPKKSPSRCSRPAESTAQRTSTYHPTLFNALRLSITVYVVRRHRPRYEPNIMRVLRAPPYRSRRLTRTMRGLLRSRSAMSAHLQIRYCGRWGKTLFWCPIVRVGRGVRRWSRWCSLLDKCFLGR